MKDEHSGWTEPDITINGIRLTFAESMAVRVAVTSFRRFVCDSDNSTALGRVLADGYDRQLATVELHMQSYPLVPK